MKKWFFSMPHLLLCVNALINMNLSGFYTFWVVTFTSTLCTVCVWVFFFHKKSIKIQFSRGISFKKVTISPKILGVELPFSILCTEGGIMQIYRLLSWKKKEEVEVFAKIDGPSLWENCAILYYLLLLFCANHYILCHCDTVVRKMEFFQFLVFSC